MGGMCSSDVVMQDIRISFKSQKKIDQASALNCWLQQVTAEVDNTGLGDPKFL